MLGPAYLYFFGVAVVQCLLALTVAQTGMLSQEELDTSTDAPKAGVAAGSILYETFGPGWEDRWWHSEDEKYTGRFKGVKPDNWRHSAIQIPEKNKHYGITTLLPEPLDPSKGFVIQYLVKFTDGINCGGAYVKLVTHAEGFQPTQLKDDTPYTIMFGPDKCGSPGKVHLILRHKNPINGSIAEHHLQDAPKPAADSKTHLYTLQIRPDNKFEIWVDGESQSKGSVLEKLEPPIVPSTTVPDPSDIKPDDWVDTDEIPDPTATKPVDWDDRKMVPDMDAIRPGAWLENEPAVLDDKDAQRPEEWDDEEDGVWAPPKIPNPKCKKAGCGVWERPNKPNPKYKGEWSAPLVPNPDYKGPWVQRTIPNPDHYEDDAPLEHLGLIGGLAVEIWTIDTGYSFGGFMITQDLAVAERYRDKVFKPIVTAEGKADRMKAAKEDAEREAKVKKSQAEVSTVHRIAEHILTFIRRKELKAVRPLLSPFESALDTNPAIILGLIAIALFFTVIAGFVLLCSGLRKLETVTPRQRPDALGRAKKEDETGEDDEDEAVPVAKPAPRIVEKTLDETLTTEVDGEDEPATGFPAGRCPFGFGAAPAAEEVEEDDEPEEEIAPKGRRRVPRAD